MPIVVIEPALFVAWIVVPIVTFICLVVAVWRRRRSPIWVPLAALISQMVLAGYSAVSLRNPSDVAGIVNGTNLVWSLLAAVLLLVATVALLRGWAARGPLVVLSLLVPAPLMAWLLAVVANRIVEVWP